MPNVPPACKVFADQVTQLEQEIAAEQASLTGLSGHEKWATVARIGALRSRLINANAALTQCLSTNVPPYATNVVLFDLTNGSVVLPLQAHLWRLKFPVQQVIETQTLQGGRVTFAAGGSIVNASIGISVTEAPNATFTGPLFRSGAMNTLPAGAPGNPGGLIEIAAAPAAQVSSAQVTAAAAAAPLPALPGGAVVTTRTVSLSPGLATLSIGGFVPVSVPIIGGFTIPFSYSLPFTISPSGNMFDTTEICVIVPSGSATFAFSGPINVLGIGVFGPLLANKLTEVVVPVLQKGMNATIASMAPSVIGRPLRPGVDVISARRVSIASAGVTLVLALGAYGGLGPLP
jgi:hypothetical protein